MKILLVGDIHPKMVNGVFVSTENLTEGLRARGHEVKQLILSETIHSTATEDVYKLPSLDVSRLYPGARLVLPVRTLQAVRELSEWKPDIIHTQTEFASMTEAFRISRRSGAPIVHTYHTMWCTPEYLKYLHGIITPEMATTILRIRFFSERLSAIIAPTEKTKRTLREYGIKKPIFVIPSGIQLSKFTLPPDDAFITGKKAEFGIRPEDRVLLYIGRIGREKNLENIIDYFARLSVEERNVKLLIVGGGPDLERLKGLIPPGSKNILFTGMVAPNDVHLYYKLGDIFVTASTSETQGITYIEAMASGLPILCRQDECIEELVNDGETGFTFLNCEEFVRKAKQLLSDQEVRTSTIAAAKEKADVFSIENFAKCVEDTYQYVK